MFNYLTLIKILLKSYLTLEHLTDLTIIQNRMREKYKNFNWQSSLYFLRHQALCCAATYFLCYFSPIQYWFLSIATILFCFLDKLFGYFHCGFSFSVWLAVMGLMDCIQTAILLQVIQSLWNQIVEQCQQQHQAFHVG